MCTRKTRELTALAITRMSFHAVVRETKHDRSISLYVCLSIYLFGEKEDYTGEKFDDRWNGNIEVN